MRPNPEDHSSLRESGRIIYLGDVRKRRAGSRRVSPDGHYLAALLLLAVSAWAVWATVIFSLPPTKLLTYVAFFAPLTVAVAATGTIAAFWSERFVTGFASLRVAGRRGVEMAAIITLNLAAFASHHWTTLLLGGSLLAAASIELLLRRRFF
jgi:hypothetical protein